MNAEADIELFRVKVTDAQEKVALPNHEAEQSKAATKEVRKQALEAQKNAIGPGRPMSS